MDLRDKARSDLYLAQLRSQSAPNTPGFKGDRSPNPYHDPHDAAENGQNYDENTQFASKHHSFSQPKPFNLQPPPIKIQNATPTPAQDGFDTPQKEIINDHVPAAPGEQTYAAVPIPGAYSSPLASPAYPPTHSMSFGQALTTEARVESPPQSPRLPHAGLR